MGIYYSANGSSFTSTLDIHPETFTKYNYDDDESDLDISYSDFTRVCNLLNSDKKDIKESYDDDELLNKQESLYLGIKSREGWDLIKVEHLASEREKEVWDKKKYYWKRKSVK